MKSRAIAAAVLALSFIAFPTGAQEKLNALVASVPDPALRR